MDIHSLLYYSKNADEVDEVITDKLLGCRMPLPAKSQKETFNAIVEESLGLECDYEVKQIDVDYAHLQRIDRPEEELKLVARALLPIEIYEGCILHYEMMQYSMK